MTKFLLLCWSTYCLQNGNYDAFCILAPFENLKYLGYVAMQTCRMGFVAVWTFTFITNFKWQDACACILWLYQNITSSLPNHLQSNKKYHASCASLVQCIYVTGALTFVDLEYSILVMKTNTFKDHFHSIDNNIQAQSWLY